MNDISLQTALRLIRYNTDSEVASILQSALDELDRLARVEKQAIELAKAALEGIVDARTAKEVLRLTGKELPEPVDNADWQRMNREAAK